MAKGEKTMSKYTTGEIAKLCNVSVRTVQYYDTRGLLSPNELSEGGRRLYSEEDLKYMRLICFLRNLDLSISTVKNILKEDNSKNVICLLLEQQENLLKNDIDDKKSKLYQIQELKSLIKANQKILPNSIDDVVHIMNTKQDLHKVHVNLLIFGSLMTLIEIGTILVWIFVHIWWPFAAGMLINVVLGIVLSKYYFEHVSYICPECHKVFRPRFKEAFWAAHTTKTRKLTCPHCHHKGYCVETFNEAMKK